MNHKSPSANGQIKSLPYNINIVLWLPALLILVSLAGCDKRQDITPTVGMDTPKKFWVRVVLFDNISNFQLAVPSGFEAVEAKTQIRIKQFKESSKPIKITVSNGRIKLNTKSLGYKEVVLKPLRPFVFITDGMMFRGNLHLSVNEDSQTFDAINYVPMEAYLDGVIGAEMPYYWEKEALKAQAVAARTYCWYIKNTFGIKRKWDVKRTQASQVYKGVGVESLQTRKAVRQTTGQILLSRNELGADVIFPAYYSSTCGGHTENSANVFGDSYETLKGADCPYCKYVAKPSSFFWKTVKFSKKHVDDRIMKRYPKLKKLSGIKKITAAKKSDYGQFSRTTLYKLTGDNGKSDFLRGEDLRLSIDPTGRKIKSTACKVIRVGNTWKFLSGRGFGHGVGMCQCGAEGMARKGKKASEILRHYYPGSKIKNIY